jgi:hypothetical protein
MPAPGAVEAAAAVTDRVLNIVRLLLLASTLACCACTNQSWSHAPGPMTPDGRPEGSGGDNGGGGGMM